VENVEKNFNTYQVRVDYKALKRTLNAKALNGLWAMEKQQKI